MANSNDDPKPVHYDSVTLAWQHIFGEQFHLGYFITEETPLDEATLALNDALAGMGTIGQGTEILDVGCGIGSPAFYLHEKHGCRIRGISTSSKGVDFANRKSEARGLDHQVRFQVADGTDNRLPASSFDGVWLMESSHTMKAKRKLLAECHRVLKPGGQMLLCDVIMRKRPKMGDHIACLFELGVNYPIGFVKIKKAFGGGRTETLEFYSSELRKLGFEELELRDVGDKVLPTFAHWMLNAERNREKILQSFSNNQLDDFLTATNLVEYLYKSGIYGYGLIKAKKLI